jgi:integrase
MAEAMGSTSPDHFLFPGFDRHKVPVPTKPRYSFYYAWNKLRKLQVVDASLRIHDFRHNYTTDLAETDTSSRTAMDHLGWSTPAMRERYEHMQHSRMDAARNAVDQVEAVPRVGVGIVP